VGDAIGGLERANGRAASEAGVGRVGELPAFETLYRGLGRDGDDVAGWPVPMAQRWVSGESEMFRDPLCEASDEVERWAGTLTRLAGGLARGELACGSP
jgi:hypothetical protein